MAAAPPAPLTGADGGAAHLRRPPDRRGPRVAPATRRHVDVLGCRLIVAESLTEVDGTFTFGPTKTHQVRDVPRPAASTQPPPGRAATGEHERSGVHRAHWRARPVHQPPTQLQRCLSSSKSGGGHPALATGVLRLLGGRVRRGPGSSAVAGTQPFERHHAALRFAHGRGRLGGCTTAGRGPYRRERDRH